MSENKYIIPKTNQTPLVEFDTISGTLTMHGKMVPENPIAFFDQINQTVDDFLKNNTSNLEINMRLDYFNTVSSKMLSKFFRKVTTEGKPTLNWFYEKDDIELKEAGEDYSTIINYPINLIELDE
jgi:SiaC family regulatory phosphoprotein